MSEFTPQEIAFQARESSRAACESAAEAQAASQQAQAATVHEPEITWTIDRTPDLTYSPIGIEEPATIYDTENLNNYYESNNFRYFNQQLPEAIPYNFSKKNIQIQLSGLEISEEDKNCCICMETRDEKDICSYNCGHKFCGFCIEICLKKPYLNCSLCRGNVTNIITQNNEIKEKLNKYCI